MKLVVNRYGLEIVSENVQDEAFIEEVLGLKRAEDKAHAMRINHVGLTSLYGIGIVRMEERE